MVPPDDDSTADEPIRYPRWWDPFDAKLDEQRASRQLDELVKAYAEAGVALGVAEDRNGVQYLYRDGYVLARDEDAERVFRALERPDVDRAWDKRVGSPVNPRGDQRRPSDEPQPRRGDGAAGVPPTPPPSVAGLTLVPIDVRPATVPGNVPAVLDYLDGVLGEGVATPDTLVHITAWKYCPATEPVPSSGPVRPRAKADEWTNGAGSCVVVVDTGLIEDVVKDPRHPWLHGVTGDEEDAASVGRYRGHGTFIAGVVRSVAPEAEVHVLAVSNILATTFETELAYTLYEAMEYLPDVISLSIGSTTRLGFGLTSLEVFWRHRLSRTKGTALVAAAGNDGCRGPFYPATFPWTLSVGALEEDGRRASYSNFGSWVDLYARGSDVVNAYPQDGEYTFVELDVDPPSVKFPDGLAEWSGTSFATPLVAGLIAARRTWSGESGRVAGEALLGLARANSRPGVGAVLDPSMSGLRA